MRSRGDRYLETNLMRKIIDEQTMINYKEQLFLLALVNKKVISEAELAKITKIKINDILEKYRKLVILGFDIKRRELSPYQYRKKGRRGRASPPKIIIYYI